MDSADPDPGPCLFATGRVTGVRWDRAGPSCFVRSVKRGLAPGHGPRHPPDEPGPTHHDRSLRPLGDAPRCRAWPRRRHKLGQGWCRWSPLFIRSSGDPARTCEQRAIDLRARRHTNSSDVPSGPTTTQPWKPPRDAAAIRQRPAAWRSRSRRGCRGSRRPRR